MYSLSHPFRFGMGSATTGLPLEVCPLQPEDNDQILDREALYISRPS
jgi:hypothetical protein